LELLFATEFRTFKDCRKIFVFEKQNF